jgi:hypothetical protein
MPSILNLKILPAKGTKIYSDDDIEIVELRLKRLYAFVEYAENIINAVIARRFQVWKHKGIDYIAIKGDREGRLT